MEYKNVTIYENEKEKFVKAVVETNIGKIEVVDVDKFNKLMKEFANQEKVTIYSLLRNNELVKRILVKEETKEVKEDKKVSTSSVELTDEEMDEIVFGPSKTKKSKKTKKKSGIVKKLVVGVVAFVVLGTGAYHLDKYHNVFNGKLVKFLHPNKKVEESSNNENSSFNQGDKFVSNNKSFTIVDTGKKNDISEYDETMKGVIERQEKTETVISKLDEKVVEMTKEEILAAINDNARIANSSLFEVSQFINDKGLNGKAYYYNFEKNFTVGSADYNAVKVFSDLRNEVLKEAFESQSIKNTKSKIGDFYSFYADTVILDKSRVINNVVVDFNELSDMGKATILELAVAMLEINYDSFEYYVDGKNFKKDAILNDAVEMLEGELVPRLIDKGYRK